MNKKTKAKQTMSSCPRCHDLTSVVSRVYCRANEDTSQRVLYCTNKGCGWSTPAPFPEQRLAELKKGRR